MRVLVTIEGRMSVHEILEFEPQEDGTVLLTTHEGAVDLVVHGMNKFRTEAVCNELLKLGYANISEYETTYDDEFESADDGMNEYKAVCPECKMPFAFHMTPEAATMGVIICPHCGEELEFEVCDDEPELTVIPANNEQDKCEDEDEELAFTAECPKCNVNVGVFQKHVKQGYVTCPFCKSVLNFDAIDAENGTLGAYDDEEEDE